MVELRTDVQHVADAVLYMANLPLGANVQSITVMVTKMPLEHAVSEDRQVKLS